MAKEGNWDYSAEEADNFTAPGAKRPASSSDFSWTASEYIDHQQSTSWYLGLGLVTLVVTALVFLLTRDLFAAVVIPIMGASMGVFAHRKPSQQTYKLSQDGLQIGAKSYPYSLFKSFSIMADGGLLSLYLEPLKRFMPAVSVYFAPADHEKIFDILQQYLPYEERQLELTERLTRRLHF